MVLVRLIDVLERQRDYPASIAYTQRLVQHDPLHEESHRRLMRLHTLNGDRTAALRAYHACATILQHDLAVEPGVETRHVYDRLLRMDTPPTHIVTSVPTFLAATPLIGRDPEWHQLQVVWRSANGGSPHLVLVTGEAGVGKSRLAEELLAWASQQGIATARTRAYAAEGRLAYAPVAEWLRSDAVRPALSRLDIPWLAEVARLLPELLGERPEIAAPAPLTERWQRLRFFQALARALLATSPPLLLQIDDLQWCDQDTLEWLHYLLRFDRQARLLIVGTVRGEEVVRQHPLTSLLVDLRGTGQSTEIALRPLGVADTTTLAAQVAGRALDQTEADLLFRETEGNPLFVVEVVRAGLAANQHQLAARTQHVASAGQPAHRDLRPLPPKVQAVIAGRLAQLSDPAREVARLAATIGRAFTLDVLIRASSRDDGSVVHGLDELLERGIVREQGADVYDFSHDRIREVAYTDMSPARRRLLHRDVAAAMEAIHRANPDPVSVQLAAQFEHAALPEQAIGYYQRAAEAAQHICSNEVAISLLNKALTLLGSLPPSQDQDTRELTLLTILGVSLVATRGYASADVRALYSRSRELCQRVGKPPSPPALRALAIASLVQGEFQQAHDLGDHLLSLAERDQDVILLVEARYVLGVTLFWKGAFAPSTRHLDHALVSYSVARSRAHIALYTQDPGVICQIRLAVDLWFLGYPERAQQQRRAALDRAEELSHPFSRAYALAWDAVLQNLRQDVGTTREQADACIALSGEHQVGMWLAMGKVLRGWALAEQGAGETAIDLMRAGMLAFRATGCEHTQPYYLALLAEQYGKLGNIERGLTLLAEALAIVERTGERWYEAELFRRRGELLGARTDRTSEAEVAFRSALAVARYQGARSIELRAATSLVRLWQRQEPGGAKQVEVCRELGEIYSWFSEGFDTPDLIEARSLLDQS
jgi:predicted ATPase